MAEELGREDFQSSALNSRGIARDKLGDARALADLERAVELADEASSPSEMAFSRNNYGSVLALVGHLREAAATVDESCAISARYGLSYIHQWSRFQRSVTSVVMGDWEDALATVDDLERRIQPESQLAGFLLYVRGWLLGVRGETDEALRLLEASLEQAERAGEPQSIAPALCATAVVLHVGSRDDEAGEAIERVLSTPDLAFQATADLCLALADLGRVEEWIAAPVPRETRWFEAAAALAAGQYAAAAEILAAMGARFHEAWARLLAAEHGDLSQLEPARAFFAEQNVVPFLRRCETVLAASA